ncbi:MAG: hypothetical protein ACK5Z5_00630 [Neisseriaceae bacterium]
MGKVINADKIKRILSEDDLSLLSGVNQYKAKVEAQCKKLLDDTHAECEKLKQDLYIEYQTKLAETTQQIREDNLIQIDTYLNHYSDNLHRLIYKILTKLNVLHLNHDNLMGIIREELWDILNLAELKVIANSANIPFLQNQLSESRLSVTYQIDDSLAEGQAVVQDSISTVYVDFNKFKDFLLHILGN